LQLQNNGNITVTFDASSNMGLGTASPSARMSVLLSNSTAYANTSPSASNCTAAFINTASHVSGGTFVGYQLNISGDSQNRIGYFGAISGTSSDQALSLVFGVNSGAGSRAEALRINSNANVILQGGTTTADGVGLTFPATQVASTNANCLDDYEEGTWTPSYNGGLTGVSYGTVRNGYYRKIGNQVTVWVGIMTDGLTVTTSSLNISGLPFTAISSFGSNGTFNINNATRWTSSPPTTGAVEPNTTTITLYNSIGATGSGTDPVSVTTGNLATGSGNRNICYGTATYIATA
jgi:hypothetical protein